MNKNKLTLGSLFDGSGGFPLAGILSGIQPVWSSEVDPFCIRVTTKRLPEVIHYGDVSSLSGAELPPVDIITFGSPCFPEGTLVLTEDGYIPIEEVEVGMKVLTHMGRWKIVTATGAKFGETVILKGNHYGLECTPNHPIYSSGERNHYPRLDNGKRGKRILLTDEKAWIPAGKMNGKLWAVPNSVEALPIASPMYSGSWRQKTMPPISDDLFYFVGRWLGDGWVCNGQRVGRPEGQTQGKVYLCDSEDKEAELREIVEKMSGNYTVSHDRGVVRFCFTSQVFAEWLTDNFGKYAFGKTMPGWVFGLQESYRESLLQGLLDSDGCRIKSRKNAWKISTVSKRLAESIRLLAEVQGYSTTVHKTEVEKEKLIEGRIVHQKDWYSVVVTAVGKQVHLSDELHGWYRVRQIRETNRMKVVYNLTVDEDNSYVADGIVVHNCQDLSIAGKRAGIHEGERSSLFFQAIRIIKEMRAKTNGEYPRYCVWENVCFDADTLVTCEDGYRRIADVSVGQRVKTLSGRYFPVMRVHQTKNQEVIRLRFRGSEDLIVTPNHPFYAMQKNKEGGSIVGLSGPEWIPAEKLTKDHLIAYRIDVPSLPDNFMSESEAWAVGRWLADGSVDLIRSNPRMFFSIGKGKEEYAREMLGKLPYEVYENKPHPTATNFCFTSKEFYALIADAGIGAGNKRVPAYVFQMPYRLQKAVLEGYVSGDGYVRIREGVKELAACTASRELAYGICRLIRNVYRTSASISVREQKIGCIDGREIIPNFPCYEIIAFPEAVSQQCRVDSSFVWQPVRGIEQIKGKRTVYNLSVLEDNTYAANDIVVHNCGAFSSNGGEDFKAVLEAVIGIKEPSCEVPAPGKNGWPYADVYMGDGWSVAYRLLDAQYWSVPQRRARIFLVADFGGGRAGDILFKSEGLSGYSPEGFEAWKRAARDPEGCTGEAGRPAVCVNTQGRSGVSVTEDVTETLIAQDHGNHPAVLAAGFCTEHSAKSRTIGYEEETSPTLRAGVVPAAIALEHHPADSRIHIAEDGIVQTLASRMGTGGGNVPLVMAPDGPVAFGISSDQSHAMLSDNPHAGIYEAETARTLDMNGGNPGCNQGGIAVVEKAYPLEGNGQRPSHKGDGWSEADTMYTLNATEQHGVAAPVYHGTKNSHLTKFSDAPAIDTLVASEYKEPPVVMQEPYYIVRRLTPTECARLQGFPDWWCRGLETPDPTEDDIAFWTEVFETHRKVITGAKKPKTRNQIIKWLKNPHLDSAEYRLWGNGLCLSVAWFVLSGIVYCDQSGT